MNRIYKIENGVVVPDGTTVYEIIGPIQSKKAGLPIIEEESLAYGELDPEEKSNVHVHPIITHLTWVVSGKLTVGMKDKRSDKMYFIDVAPNETVLTEPGTFFQLINNGSEICKVLYIVAPAFIFEIDDAGTILYNDQIVLDFDWDELERRNWTIPELNDLDLIRKQREESLRRLNAKSNSK
jgi:mannose-6-phosphate isomerase-like protein (cupin superfamily)